MSKLTPLCHLTGQSGYPGPLKQIHFLFPWPTIWDCRKASLTPTLMKESTRLVPAGVPHPTRRLRDRSPTPCGKPPRGSPQRLWQLLLSPVTTCQHVAFCTSGCHSSVPAEGAAPSLHPAVIATAQGFRQAGHSSAAGGCAPRVPGGWELSLLQQPPDLARPWPRSHVWLTNRLWLLRRYKGICMSPLRRLYPKALPWLGWRSRLWPGISRWLTGGICPCPTTWEDIFRRVLIRHSKGTVDKKKMRQNWGPHQPVSHTGDIWNGSAPSLTHPVWGACSALHKVSVPW